MCRTIYFLIQTFLNLFKLNFINTFFRKLNKSRLNREYILLRFKVIGSIMHQYRELYLRNNGELPTELPTAEDQLTYICEFYKKTMKRLEIHKNLESGKITIKDYISKAK